MTYLLIDAGEYNDQKVTCIVTTKFLRKKETEGDCFLSLPRNFEVRFETREQTESGGYAYKLIKTGNAWDLLKAIKLHNDCKDFGELLYEKLPF